MTKPLERGGENAGFQSLKSRFPRATGSRQQFSREQLAQRHSLVLFARRLGSRHALRSEDLGMSAREKVWFG